MIVHDDVVQRSPEWHALRLGRLCGSRAADMLATIQKGESASRRNLRVQLVLERLTGKSQERNFQSQAMQDGIEREDAAAGVYERMTGKLMRSVGFVSHATLMAGCSPDGVIGEFEGLAEIKSPIPATHLDYLETGVIPGEYLKQIIHGLWLTGAQWCDWLSYQPEFPEPLQVKLVRVPRDEAAISAYDGLVKTFLAEVDRKVADVQRMMERAA